MHPIVFQLGNFTLHSYGLLLTAGVLAGLWLLRRRAFAAGLDGDQVWNLSVYAILSALLVAKIWYVAAEWSYFRHNPREIFSLATLQSGGVFYGGFLGGLVVVLGGARYLRLPALKLMDVVSPSLMLGAAIGRLGCFSAGCCWGSQTRVAWAVTFTDPYANTLVGTPLGVALHPAQLYNFAAAFAIFLFLLWLGRRQRFEGQLFAALAILYGASRFVTEFFRGDPGRDLGFTAALTQAQLAGIFLVLAGAVVWWRGRAAR
jgi:phosphatidylglycerol:prolipoprotein diacylglycerol transferase